MTVCFEHKGVIFRQVEEGDLGFLVSLRNDFTTWRELGDPRLLKIGAQKKWLEGLQQSQDRFYFIAGTEAYKRIKGLPEQLAVDRIALVRMDEYDVVNRSIRIGTDVAPELRGQGYGTRIFQAMESYAFDFLGVHRVWLLVLETNAQARALYAKRGFKLEGRMRQAIFRDGAWRDYLMMSLLEPEYRKRNS